MAFLDPDSIRRAADGSLVFNRAPQDGLAGMGIVPVLTAVSALSGMKKILDWVGSTASGGVENVRVIEIPDGEAGTEATVNIMTDLAFKAAHDPSFVMWVRNLVPSSVASKDYETEIQTVFDWVKNNIRYMNDPRGLELITDPRVLAWQTKVEDCDGHATLIAAMGLALGHGAKFVCYKVDPNRPEEFSHVLVFLGYRNPRTGQEVWKPMDTTQIGGFVGWVPPANRVLGQREWVVASA